MTRRDLLEYADSIGRLRPKHGRLEINASGVEAKQLADEIATHGYSVEVSVLRRDRCALSYQKSSVPFVSRLIPQHIPGRPSP